MSKYSEKIMEAVRYNKWEIEDESKDAEIEKMSSGEIFKRVLEYEGFYDYDEWFKNLVKEVYGVQLNDNGITVGKQ